MEILPIYGSLNIIIKERHILKGKFERKDPNILKFKLKKKKYCEKRDLIT